MNLTELFQKIEPKITGGTQFCWQCFGPNAQILDIWPDISVVYDTKTQEVYQISVYEDSDDEVLINKSWVHPDYQQAYDAEYAKNVYDDGQYEEIQVSIQDVLEIALRDQQEQGD